MTDQPSPSEADLLAEVKLYWTERLRFYSNKGKAARERWVVGEFLSRLSVPFTPDELHSPPQRSKVDVEFRTARFQVKEIPDPNFQCGYEVKDTYRRVMAAKTLRETVGGDFIYDVPTVVSGYEIVLNNARDLAFTEQYMETKANLDLLFYVTRTRASIIKMCEVMPENLSSFGWRSVSCVMGNHALVLYATLEAPVFLRVAP